MTHDDLVEAGRQWLLRPHRLNSVEIKSGHCFGRGACSLVLTEIVTQVSETPDVIGWYGTASVILEAKVSRSDFLADQKKPFRRYPKNGMGRFRYYIAPRALIKPSELPGGWGLIEVSDGKTRVVHGSWAFETRSDYEVAILLSLIRRFEIEPGRHTSIRVYTTHIDEPTATATIEPNKEGS